MKTDRIGRLCVACALCATTWYAAGCATPGFSSEFGRVAAVIAQKVADEGILEKFTSNMDGHVQDPGLESYFTVTTAAGVRMRGFNGNIDLMTSGTATNLPSGVRESLIEQLDGPISDEQRENILAILGWNRRQVDP